MTSGYELLIAFLAALPPTIAALAALVMSLRNNSKITEVHMMINNRMDQMLGLKDELITAAKDATAVAVAAKVEAKKES